MVSDSARSAEEMLLGLVSEEGTLHGFWDVEMVERTWFNGGYP